MALNALALGKREGIAAAVELVLARPSAYLRDVESVALNGGDEDVVRRRMNKRDRADLQYCRCCSGRGWSVNLVPPTIGAMKRSSSSVQTNARTL